MAVRRCNYSDPPGLTKSNVCTPEFEFSAQFIVHDKLRLERMKVG